MKLPSDRQADAAHRRGVEDALAGLDRDRGPYRRDGDDVQKALHVMYQRGYGVGVQQMLQRDFGNTPTE